MKAEDDTSRNVFYTDELRQPAAIPATDYFLRKNSASRNSALLEQTYVYPATQRTTFSRAI